MIESDRQPKSSQARQGIKASLQQVDTDILCIQKQLSDNELRVVNLKNEACRLQSTFQSKADETQRNLRIDLESFETKIKDSFHTHANMVKMLDKRLKDIERSQVDLAQTLLNVGEKVQQMEQLLG